MTDNEIVKALECCKQRDCLRCERVGSDHIDEMACRYELLASSIDLINRQKEEIESMEAEIDKQYEQARADILGNMADGGTSCHWCIAQHRANAIKEFAERLKEELTTGTGVLRVSALDIIDNLVKEMTEETK